MDAFAPPEYSWTFNAPPWCANNCPLRRSATSESTFCLWAVQKICTHPEHGGWWGFPGCWCCAVVLRLTFRALSLGQNLRDIRTQGVRRAPFRVFPHSQAVIVKGDAPQPQPFLEAVWREEHIGKRRPHSRPHRAGPYTHRGPGRRARDGQRRAGQGPGADTAPTHCHNCCLLIRCKAAENFVLGQVQPTERIIGLVSLPSQSTCHWGLGLRPALPKAVRRARTRRAQGRNFPLLSCLDPPSVPPCTILNLCG